MACPLTSSRIQNSAQVKVREVSTPGKLIPSKEGRQVSVSVNDREVRAGALANTSQPVCFSHVDIASSVQWVKRPLLCWACFCGFSHLCMVLTLPPRGESANAPESMQPS